MSLTWSERVIEAAALFLLVFTPLAFGTTEPWSEAVAELVVLGMVIVYVVSTVRNWEIRVELPPGWLPAALFLGLATLQLIAGWSADWLGWRRPSRPCLAPQRFPLGSRPRLPCPVLATGHCGKPPPASRRSGSNALSG